MEKQELKQQKSDKPSEERERKKHKRKAVKEHKAVVNGKEHTEGSGTMTFSYKKLQVPKEIIKKTKKLVETTTGLNNTFIQFIQQTAEEQGDKSIRYRHLKAFKAVLADLKKAHSALEAALVPEFKSMELQNGNEEQHEVRKNAEASHPVTNDQVDDVAEAGIEANVVRKQDEEQVKEQDEQPHEDLNEEPPEDLGEELNEKQNEDAVLEQHNKHVDQDMEIDQMPVKSEMKDSQTGNDATKKIIKTEICDDALLSTSEMSLDHDIMSVPASVPEELFQMVESLADSSILSQKDVDQVSHSDTKPDKKPITNSTDSERPQPKVKNLIVKLTPVPVVTTIGSRASRSKSKENDEEVLKKSKDEKCEEKEDEAEEDEPSSPPPSRRSSRVKTTPLRKQADNTSKEESSESETEKNSKKKAKSSKKPPNSKKEEDEKEESKASEKKTLDSDSDVVPDILLEKAAAANSTDEEKGATSAKKCLFKSNNTSAQDMEKASKRKRKSKSSDSDSENKNKKTSKKKKSNDSGSSDSDSDQEKEKKSKGSTARRRSSRVKKQDETKEEKKSPERKAADRKRSYEKKRKRPGPKGASKHSSSSDDDEEEQQPDGDSGEDSDQQKIKPILEDNVVGASGPFHQSSGKLMLKSVSWPSV